MVNIFKGVSKIEKAVMLAGIVIFSIMSISNKNGVDVPTDGKAWLQFSVNVSSTAIMWLTNLLLAQRIRQRYPSLQQTGWRFATTLACCLAASTCINQASIYIGPEYAGMNDPEMDLKNFLHYTINLALMVFLINGILEAIYQQQLFQQAQKQKNDLLRQQAETRLGDLKGKVNPHFLFNSLNTVSSLIYSDTNKAEYFVEEMSTVYRYLLRNFDDQLITLESEIAFARSYSSLLLIRFEGALKVDINPNEHLLPFYVPATTLQLLLDYIIRTNVISNSSPLCIRIGTERAQLIIEHNRQPKKQLTMEETPELEEIISRYRPLANRDVDIVQTEKQFRISLPLQTEAAVSNQLKTVHEHETV